MATIFTLAKGQSDDPAINDFQVCVSSSRGFNLWSITIYGKQKHQ